MLVRNQVRRHLWSRYGGTSLQIPTRGTTPGLKLEGGTLRNGGGGVPHGILNATKRGERAVPFRPGFMRHTFPWKAFSTTTPLTPKSTTPDIPPEENSYQISTLRNSRRYFPTLPSSANFHDEAKRAAQDRLGTSSWRKLCYIAGAGAAAVVMLVGAVAAVRYEDGSSARFNEVFLWCILWDSLDEFKDKMGIFLRDSVVDVIEAASATAILARCLISVLLTVGEEPTVGLSGWLMPGVAALVADLIAHEVRRKAVVEAGGGRVVDWLPKAVGIVDPGVSPATQAQASRALAHLISDENTCEAVLSRPHALPYLF